MNFQMGKIILIGVAVIMCLFLFVVQLSRSPINFPTDSIVTIASGTTVSNAANILAQKGVIRSPWMYRLYTILFDHNSGIKAGSYLFDQPQSALRIAYRTAYGIQDLVKIKVTIPEGSNSRDVARLVGKLIPNFASSTASASLYLLAKQDEGYLFPDTYYFYQNTTPEQIVQAMRDNFDVHAQLLASSTQSFIAKNHLSMDDVVTMASIVEKEATSTTDRRIVAGILWKRYFDTYPLQVDPPFFYILNKDSSQLTTDDLAVNSPYNLYKHTGLPPTPIDNPGMDALFSTVTPTDTKYWYYLSDAHGVMHYATTYEGHLANKAKYVR